MVPVGQQYGELKPKQVCPVGQQVGLIAFAGSWHATGASAGQLGPESPRGQPPLYVARF